MRTAVMVYCVLTLLFAGGCALLLVAVEGTGDVLFTLPYAIVGLAALANGAFAWMVRRAPGRQLMASGIIYAGAQCLLAWKSELWLFLGLPAILVVGMFLIKGAAVFLAGREAPQKEN